MGLSFTIAAGPHQCSRFRVRVPWDSRPYFTLLDLKFPLSSPPTTRRVTVEVFDPTPTRVTPPGLGSSLYSLGTETTEKQPRTVPLLLLWDVT
jgi:hypothetical protein